MPVTAETPARELVEVLREHGATRAEIRLEQWDGRRVVVKDFGVGTWALRLIGLVLMAREWRAHRRLVGVPGIPACLRRERWRLTFECVEGAPIPLADPEALTPEYFARLYDLVREMHARGVAHGDLKSRNNVLVDINGLPAVVDFSAAFTLGRNPVEALIVPYLKEDDLRAIGKTKLRSAPHLLTAEEEQLLARKRPFVQAAARFLHGVRLLIKRVSVVANRGTQ